MVKKFLFFCFLSYFFVLIQTSFFPHFFPKTSLNEVLNIILNPSLFLVLAINFFEKSKSVFGILIAFFTGFFFDIFSEKFFGFYIVTFILIALLIKFLLKRYVQIF